MLDCATPGALDFLLADSEQKAITDIDKIPSGKGHTCLLWGTELCCLSRSQTAPPARMPQHFSALATVSMLTQPHSIIVLSAGMPQFTVGWWVPLYNAGAQLGLVSFVGLACGC